MGFTVWMEMDMDVNKPDQILVGNWFTMQNQTEQIQPLNA